MVTLVCPPKHTNKALVNAMKIEKKKKKKNETN